MHNDGPLSRAMTGQASRDLFAMDSMDSIDDPMLLEIKGFPIEVRGIGKTVRQEIDKACRFEPDGISHSPKFQSGDWDGFVHLYRYGKFPIGLLNRVVLLLEMMEQKYSVIDYRVCDPPVEIPSNITLRDYQIPIVENAVKRGGGLMQMPCAAGKTVCFLELLARLGHVAMIMVPTQELVDQTIESGREFLGIEIAHATTDWIRNESRDWLKPYWSVATWQAIHSLINQCKVSHKAPRPKKDEKFEAHEERVAEWRVEKKNAADLRRVMEKLFIKYDSFIFDECHLAGARCVYEVCSWFPARYRYGTSATPFRNDGSDLRMYACTGELLKGISRSELIRSDYLVRPTIQFVKIPGVKCSDYRKWQTIYKEGVVEHRERTDILVREAICMADKEGRVTLVMVKERAHGNIMKSRFDELYWEDVPFVHGKTGRKKRKEITTAFRAGELSICIASGIWSQGVDFPVVSGLVFAGPYRSPIITDQQLGRGLRPDKKSGKEDLKAIDTWDNMPYLRDWSHQRFDQYSCEEEFIVKA